jgi:hypothetical protein
MVPLIHDFKKLRITIKSLFIILIEQLSPALFEVRNPNAKLCIDIIWRISRI